MKQAEPQKKIHQQMSTDTCLIWTTRHLWYQFRDVDLEKDYCAQKCTQNFEHVRDAKMFEYFLVLGVIYTAFFLAIDLYVVGLDLPIKEVARLALCMSYPTSSWLVNKFASRTIYEYALLYPLVMMWPMNLLMNPLRPWWVH